MSSAVETQNAPTLSAVKGAWLSYEPHWAGVLLKTGFQKFECMCGVDGLAKEYDLTIEVLAVNAKIPGTGQFRIFITGLKEFFTVIYIWEVWNPDLRQTLKRYGFRKTRRVEPDETISGFKWTSVHST